MRKERKSGQISRITCEEVGMGTVMPGDEVAVQFNIRVQEVVHKQDKGKSLVWGLTDDGVAVCVPLSAVTEKFPELGNGGEEIKGTGWVRP